MDDRFLRYSLEHGRKIRAVLMLEGAICQKTVQVTALEPDAALLRFGARRTPTRVLKADILSCDYARGDHGE